MTHSDDEGLVLPPALAPVHAVIVPIYRNDEQRSKVMAAAETIKATLSDIDIAPPRARYRDFLEVRIDDRDLRPGAKFYHWERRGVPMRIELGPKDLDKGQVCVKMRIGAGKEFIEQGEFLAGAADRLARYQASLRSRAQERRAAMTVTLDTWDDFLAAFAGDKSVFAWCHWDGTAQTEAEIKAETKATIRCVPLPGQGPAPEPAPGKCIKTGAPSAQRVLIAKAY
jgi:prolyl-tRNA synthetase